MTPVAECTPARPRLASLAGLIAGCGLLVACATHPAVPPSTPPATTPASPVATATAPTPVTSPLPSHPPTDVPATIATAPAPATPAATTYTVQPGDTLLGLAMAHGVPMAAIQLQNGMAGSTLLRAGAVLTIPHPTGWEEASPFWVVHVVEPGETLAGIARTYDLEVQDLQAINDPGSSGVIHAGDPLVLPLDAPAAAYAPTATPLPPSPTPTPPTATPVPPAAPTAVPAAPPADVADWPRETVRLINEVRAQHGLPPFAYNDALAQAAQAHADDCNRRGWCSHTGSDGADIKARILRTGYAPGGWAECWAWSRNPQHALDMWMDETPPDDPHRRTLLSTWLTEIGVGVAEASWGYYFIADFGRP